MLNAKVTFHISERLTSATPTDICILGAHAKSLNVCLCRYNNSTVSRKFYSALVVVMYFSSLFPYKS